MKNVSPLLLLGILACTGPAIGTLIDDDFDSGLDSDTDSGTDTDTDTDPEPVEIPEYVALFDANTFPTFELEIPPESWDAIQAGGKTNQTYQLGTFKYGDVVLENVGIRLKGRASYRSLDEKAAFKIKFGEFVDGQTFLGLRRLTLNNQVQDPSSARERIGYKLFRAVGLDAPLCNSARVYVNGEYFGVYANVQSIDKTFIKDHAPDKPVGNLYDTINDVYFTDLDRSRSRDQSGSQQEERFQLETNTNEGDLTGLTNLLDAVYNDDKTDGWYTGDLETHLDLDQFLMVGAVQALIADWDGFFGARNNYKMYHDPATEKFILYPWGIDQTFGMRSAQYEGPNYCIDGSSSERVNALLFVRCRAEAECWSRYVSALESALQTFESMDWESPTDRIQAQIEQAIKEDPRTPYSYTKWSFSLDQLRSFLDRRADAVSEQLNGKSCP